MSLEDKSDAFGRLSHEAVARDLLALGIPADMVYRTIFFWSHAKTHIITSAGLTAAYVGDHAAVLCETGL